MSNYSENEDDPGTFESSGDEWKEEEEEEKKTTNRRSSQRLSKKPRKKVVDVGSSDEDSDIQPKRKKSKNGVAKKSKGRKESEGSVSDEKDESKSEKSEESSDSKPAPASTPVSKGASKKFVPKTIYSEDYAAGSFVILKKDAQVGDPSKHPAIWRIDGKSLLQKYEAFDEDGKVRHKNTSVYTGWSPMDKDLYAPITVDVIQHVNQNFTVELHWDKLKDIIVDSD